MIVVNQLYFVAPNVELDRMGDSSVKRILYFSSIDSLFHRIPNPFTLKGNHTCPSPRLFSILMSSNEESPQLKAVDEVLNRALSVFVGSFCNDASLSIGFQE